MAWIPGAVVETLLVMVFTWWLLRHYAMPSTGVVYLSVVYVSWFMGFGGTLLLPIDIAEAYDEFGSVTLLKSFWYLVYWVTFILAWAVIPVLQEFYAAGEFTARGRLITAVRANVRAYLAMLVAGLAFVIWVLSTSTVSFSDLPSYMLTLANTWGLLLIVFSLGYGLVEVPRKFWHMSDPEEELRRLEFRAPELDAALFDAKCALEEIIAEAEAASRKLGNAPPGSHSKELQESMEIILNKCLPATGSPSSRNPTAHQGEITMPYLASLHARLKAEHARAARAQHRWDSLLEQCRILETTIDGTVPPSTQNLADTTQQSRCSALRHTLLWRWRLHSKWAYKALAFLSFGMSLAVLWCEVVIPLNTSSRVDTNLSVFGQVIQRARTNGLRQVLALIPLMYICCCTYLSLFRLKLFNGIELSGNRQSDAYSLLFNAAYLCRLQFSLAYNFLGAVNITPLTAYERSVGGNMELIPHLNGYLPVLLLVFSLATLCNLFERMLRLIGIEQKGSPRKGNAEDEETIADGRSLTRKGRHSTRPRASNTSRRRDVEQGERAPGAGASASGSVAPSSASSSRGPLGRYRPPSGSEVGASLTSGLPSFRAPTSGIPAKTTLEAFMGLPPSNVGGSTADGESSPGGNVRIPKKKTRGGYGRL